MNILFRSAVVGILPSIAIGVLAFVLAPIFDAVAQIRRDLCSLHFAFFEQAFIHRAQDLFLSLGKRY